MVEKTSARLKVVGIGPGDAALLTGQARQALEQARTVVGYGRYLELLPPELLRGKKLTATGMTKEMERCEQAIAAAMSGEPTVVVSSGDAGVYGMAGLVLELAHEKGLAHVLDVEIVPGVPALMAAAAILGAPLMHDFAAVSLSDLLTPWERIETRLSLAARADFVIGIYNPRSKRRDWQLPRAKELLLAELAPETPVGVVRQAFRKEQEHWTCTLHALDPARVDMLCILVVGNSATRLVDGRMVTPRGYFEKYGTPAADGC